MSAPEHRFVDADVRGDESLAELAYEYLDAYRGDWEVLVELQDIVGSGYELPTAQLRKVLNCMRNDADWAHRLPRPGRQPTRAAAPRLRVVRDPEPRPRRKERPHRVEAPAVVRWKFGCPRSRGNLHLVSQGKVLWYLPFDWFDSYERVQVGQREPILVVLWACGRRAEQPTLSPDGEDLAGRYVESCRGCFGDA